MRFGFIFIAANKFKIHFGINKNINSVNTVTVSNETSVLNIVQNVPQKIYGAGILIIYPLKPMKNFVFFFLKKK